MKQFILIILSLFFVFLSFYPTLYEIQQAKNLPKDRAFELVHNYVFDYNFYLSRIREGQPAHIATRSVAGGEGKWLVSEKYYNQPHNGSLFQIFYLLLGKLGGLGGLEPPVIYHGARLILGLVLLVLLGKFVSNLFTGIWQLAAYLFIITAGSWPILVKLGDGFRFSTHWSGWSAIDSLLRITFIPHVLAGQIFLVLFVWKFSEKAPKLLQSLLWGVIGLVAGIVFPPMLIVIYTIFVVMIVLEYLLSRRVILVSEERAHPESESDPGHIRQAQCRQARMTILPKIIFIFISLPALLYLQVMFKVLPWSALALFDIQHRSILSYAEYALALGPMLPFGVAGLILALVKKKKKFFPFVSWIITLGVLFAIFEHVPQQSPTRFTQMLITVPLGILAANFFYYLWHIYDKYKRSHAFVIRIGLGSIMTIIILIGLVVMFSMVGWKTDEVRGKQAGTWLYPVGVQLVYPLKDFMSGIDYLRLNTRTSEVVLAYEAAGNYIPAYSGNFVYLGHANTPDEDNKLKIAARFFKGEMGQEEAKKFLIRENIKYIYFGPQERELRNINNLSLVYPFLISVYTNSRITIYK